MKFCFGTLANILVLCGIPQLKKLRLVNEIVKSVDSSANLTSYTVTTLLQCAANLPDSRSNGLGEIITKARDAEPRKVAQYFAKNVIRLIDPNKRKLAVLAIRDLVMSDDISNDTVVEMVSGTTKKALQKQSQFVLSDFLAGVFLFSTTLDNRAGKAVADEIAEEYMQSFAAVQDSIAFVVPQAEVEARDDSTAFDSYLANAREKYGEVKTLLFKDEPKPFYCFYVPNHVEHRVGRGQPVVINGITAATLTTISNFLILDGVGGLGKSMMLCHLLLNAIDEFRAFRRVPVFLPLKDYSESAGSLFDFIQSKVDALNIDIGKKVFENMLRDGSFLLLFDGLDEIGSGQHDRFERAIEAFTDKYPKNCYVISSRPYQNFVSYSRFTVIKIRACLKTQDYWTISTKRG